MRRLDFSRALLISWLLLLAILDVVHSAPATQRPAVFQQPDGTSTPPLHLSGDERYSWLTDGNGYTVIKDDQGWYVYAKKTPEGTLVSAGVRVGHVNPKKLGLQPQVLHDSVDQIYDAHDTLIDEKHFDNFRRGLQPSPISTQCTVKGTATNPCYLKQLALLVQFGDHSNRKLPPPESIYILFNRNGAGNNETGSSGSVSDVYRANSLDTYVIDTHVTPWQQITTTELYASGGQNGFNLPQTREAWKEAMLTYVQNFKADLQHALDEFDTNNDGYLDSLVIVHSGVPAEENGIDCETGHDYKDRIWSHAVPKSWEFDFLADTDLGIHVGRFFVVSAVSGICPPTGAGGQWDTGRIAVAVHESGHSVGLPDLYGNPTNSYGIGHYGFMGKSSSWSVATLTNYRGTQSSFIIVSKTAGMFGWDESGNNPGMLSGYSRSMLGWLEIVDIPYSATIEIMAACETDKIFRITHRMPVDNNNNQEFFLIENRYGCNQDYQLVNPQDPSKPRQGIAIWHVDHTNLLGQVNGKDVVSWNTFTYPGPVGGGWPAVHSRVSIIQGDGLYELESKTATR